MTELKTPRRQVGSLVKKKAKVINLGQSQGQRRSRVRTERLIAFDQSGFHSNYDTYLDQ